jgi:hypothetical protein
LNNEGTFIISPKSQAVVTKDQFITIELSQAGVVNLQVLLTTPGERVVGIAGRVSLGLRDSRPKPQMA